MRPGARACIAASRSRSRICTATLKLLDTFAEKREFFDDDPHRELRARRLDVDDFTKDTDWDAYPVVGYLLEIWAHTREFVKAVVEDTYANDGEVTNDAALQAWIAASGHPSKGNVRGPPDVTTRAGRLEEVLTSLLYRVNVHGAAGLSPSVNPGLAFVANFPPCVQSPEIPQPNDEPDLLEFLPHTGTIGGMTTFFFTFEPSSIEI